MTTVTGPSRRWLLAKAGLLFNGIVGAILAVRGDLAAAEKEFEAAVRASGGKLTEAKRNLDYCRSRAAKLVAAMVTSGFAYTGRRGTMF